MISKLPDEEEGKNKSLTNSEAFQNNLRQITSKLSQNSEKEKNKLNENEIEKGKEVQPGSNQDEIVIFFLLSRIFFLKKRIIFGKKKKSQRHLQENQNLINSLKILDFLLNLLNFSKGK